MCRQAGFHNLEAYKYFLQWMLWWCQRFSGNLLFELHCRVPSTVELLLCPCCLHPTPPTLRLLHKAHDDSLTWCCCCSFTVCCWTVATAVFCIHIDSAADSVLLQLVNHMGCSFLNIYCCFIRCSCQALLRSNHGWNPPDPHVLRLVRSIISRGKQFLGLQFAKEEEEEEEMNSTRTQCHHICENLHQMQLLLNNPTHPKKKRKKKQPINKNRPWYQTVIFMQTHQTDLKRKKRSSVLTTELAAQQRDTANNNNNKLTLLVHSYCIHISQELPGKKTRKNSVVAAEQSKANADWRETVLRDNRCARGRARNNRRSEKMGIN